MGVVKDSPPRELTLQATKVVILSNSNVSLDKFIEEIEKFIKIYNKWMKNKAHT